MKLRRRLTVLWAVLACHGAWAATTPQDGGLQWPEAWFPELEAVLRAAVAEAPRLEILRERVREQEGEARVLESWRRLRVDSNLRLLGAYEMRSDIDDRFRGTVHGNVQAAKPLYHWNRLENQSEIGRLRRELGAIEFERGGQHHLAEVRRVFLEWVLAGEHIAVLERSTEVADGLLAYERGLLDIGRGTEASVMELEARLLEGRERLAHQERERARLERRLEELTGEPGVVSGYGGTVFPDIETLDLNGLEMLARRLGGRGAEHSPGVRFEETMREIEDRRYAIVARNRYPRLDFVTGIHTDQLEAFDRDDFALRMQYFAGVQVSWNIFDGRRTEGEKMAALARRRVHELQADAERQRMGAETAGLLDELEFVITQLSARATRADLLRRRADLLDEQAERGLASARERLEARLDYEDTRLRVLEARAQYLVHLMHLAALHTSDPWLQETP